MINHSELWRIFHNTKIIVDIASLFKELDEYSSKCKKETECLFLGLWRT